MEPLPSDVKTKLRSGINIASIAHCVEELVQNAVDSGSTCIAARVDMSLHKVQVIDNGSGISKENLGRIGTRYMTSKHKTAEQISDAKKCYDNETWSTMFTRGARKTVEAFYQKRQSSGTTVTVVDFMYNLPVRKKLINPSIDLIEIRQAIVGIALSNPTVSFTLRNELTGEKIIQTSRSDDPELVFQQVFGERYDERALLKVDHQKERYALTGFIAKEGSASKEKQFLYVRRRFVRHSRLLKTVNQLFRQSLICKVTKEHRGDKDRNQGWRDPEASPSKLRKMYPVFVLSLDCPRDETDFMFEPRRTEVEFTKRPEVEKFIGDGISSVLREHNLLPTVDNLMADCADRGPPPPKIARLPNITGIVPLEMTAPENVVNDGKRVTTACTRREKKDAVEPALLEGVRESRPVSRVGNDEHEEMKRIQFLATSTPCPKAARVKASSKPSYEVDKKGLFVKCKPQPLKNLKDSKKDSMSLSTLRQRFQAAPSTIRTRNKDPMFSSNSTITTESGALNDGRAVARNDEGYWTDSFGKRSLGKLGKSKGSGTTEPWANFKESEDLNVWADKQAFKFDDESSKRTIQDWTAASEEIFPRHDHFFNSSSNCQQNPHRGSSTFGSMVPFSRPRRHEHVKRSVPASANTKSARGSKALASKTLAWKSSVDFEQDELDFITKTRKPSVDSGEKTMAWKSTVVSMNEGCEIPNRIEESSEPQDKTVFWKSTIDPGDHGEDRYTGWIDKTMAWRNDVTNVTRIVNQQEDENLDEEEFLAQWAKSNRCETVVKLPPTISVTSWSKGRKVAPFSDEEYFPRTSETNISHNDSLFSIPSGDGESNQVKGNLKEQRWQSCVLSKGGDFPGFDGDEMRKSTKPPNGWISKVHNGAVVYVNVQSGIVVSNIASCYKHVALQSQTKTGANGRRQQRSATGRRDDGGAAGLLPSGKSPFLNVRYKSSMIPTNPALDDSGLDLDTVKWNTSTRAALRNWKNPAMKFEQSFFRVNSAAKMPNFGGDNIRFQREALQRHSLLGQIDKKFIAGSILLNDNQEFLVLFDQHAVHERIRLESLLREHQSENQEEPSCRLDEPIRLFREEDHDTQDINSYLIVEKIPKCLIMTEDGEWENFKPSTRIKFIRSLVEDIIEELKETRGGGLGVLPKTIRYVLNSRACRGAIKFGDSLSSQSCVDLIDKLSNCDLPFQCAHGRPSIAPVINLSNLSEKISKKQILVGNSPNFSQLRHHVQQL